LSENRRVGFRGVTRVAQPATGVRGGRRRIQRIAENLGYRRDLEIARLMEHLRTSRARRSESKIAVVAPELDRQALATCFPITEMVKGIEAPADGRVSKPDLFSLIKECVRPGCAASSSPAG
jgi:hypothetical protein